VDICLILRSKKKEVTRTIQRKEVVSIDYGRRPSKEGGGDQEGKGEFLKIKKD